MNILITVATIQEINPFINAFALNEKTKNKLFFGKFKKYNITLLITDIGVVSTTYNLTKEIIRTKYDLAFNVGIAGSFKKDIAIGDVVNVMEDRFSEFGVEDGDKFISFNELKPENRRDNLGIIDLVKNTSINIPKSFGAFRKVKGITVNTVHGEENSILKIREKFDPDIETMEGAAFMQVCKAENIHYIQLRSISNFIETRNKQKWNIPFAIQKLNEALISLFENENF